MSTKVIHVKDMPNYPDAVYVGRAMPRQGLKASKWANPYRIDSRVDGRSRFDVMGMYKRDLEFRSRKRYMLADLPELRNAPALACWCRHDGEARTDDNACHADVLLDLLDRYTDDELRAMGGAK